MSIRHIGCRFSLFSIYSAMHFCCHASHLKKNPSYRSYCLSCVSLLGGKKRQKKTKKKTTVFYVTPVPVLIFDKFIVEAAMKSAIDTKKAMLLTPGGCVEDTAPTATQSCGLEMLMSRPITRKLYVDMNCERVTQNVNMSLLRLIYHFLTLVNIVSKSYHELKQMDVEPRNYDIPFWNISWSSSSGSESRDVAQYRLQQRLQRSVSQDHIPEVGMCLGYVY